MAAILQIQRQHLIDPELCARCNGCEDACPQRAISHDYQNYAIDPALCGGCQACMDACSTGAINSWRNVLQTYSVDEQLIWLQLPEQDVALGAALLDAANTDVAHTIVPSTAATPVVNRYTRQQPAQARIAANVRLTPATSGSHVHHVVLDFGSTEFPVLEGQCLSIVPPGLDQHGHQHHVRVYSVASARDGEQPGTNTVALTVKRVTEDYHGHAVRGVCSNYLCDLQVGAVVAVTGPSGSTFLMPEDTRAPLLMICTGTGIAPMRAMIERRRRLTSAGAAMMLFYGGRTPQEMAYYEQLRQLPATLLDANFACSRATDQPRLYVQDLLRNRADAVARCITELGGYLYVCGLRGMEAGINDTLRDILGARHVYWDELLPQLQRTGRYHVEVY